MTVPSDRTRRAVDGASAQGGGESFGGVVKMAAPAVARARRFGLTGAPCGREHGAECGRNVGDALPPVNCGAPASPQAIQCYADADAHTRSPRSNAMALQRSFAAPPAGQS